MMVKIIRRVGLLTATFCLLILSGLQFALVSSVAAAEAPTVDYVAADTYSGTIYYRVAP